MEDGDANDLELVKSAALEGGRIAKEYFEKDPEVWYKDNKSPVSAADLAVDGILSSKLKIARPDYGWLSEETTDSDDRLTRECVFVVDPIDGTREFLAGRDNWTISIAIVRKGRPYVAAIYNPIKDEMYDAQAGGGARLNGKQIEVSNLSGLEGARLCAPKKIRKNSVWTKAGIGNRVYIGSLAYRLAMLGSGQLEALVVKATAHDWDIAAGDLIIEESGGRLTDIEGSPIVYNRVETVHPAMVAAPSNLFEQVKEAADQSL